MSLTFLTLYPNGAADYLEARDRTVSYIEYAAHLMKYKDGRFVKHPRWRYVVFNTYMRQQTNKKAQYLVKKHPQHEELTIDQLRAALEGDENDPVSK